MAVCPVCNGLCAVEKTCPWCGHGLSDAGVLQDLYDSYSPYLDRGVFEDGYPVHQREACPHLFACPNCRAGAVLSFRRLAEGEIAEAAGAADLLEREYF